ncbi:MAG: type II toxin-antitoxin system death-on-curing family toxin [Candidatus Zambryskibacteria bacterium]|nr:type II toxin-antitoxin system death-on-curing family toxin [Candidatus Zambryskibacteria bacterium]
MKYLKAEDILVIHSEVIDETGGLHGIRDVSLFLSIIKKSQSRFGGKDLYKGVFKKAAVYLESFVQYHIFLDGNKRTGAISAARFLYVNGYELSATNKDLENFVIQVVVKKLDLNIITAWLKKHSRKLKKQ